MYSTITQDLGGSIRSQVRLPGFCSDMSAIFFLLTEASDLVLILLIWFWQLSKPKNGRHNDLGTAASMCS